MNTVKNLAPEMLFNRCNPEQFTFKTTADLETLEGLIGQSRALEAVQFGISIRQEGYNLYVLGPHGTGKHTAVSQFLTQKAGAETTPNDWCYVNNFGQPHKPHALQLPPGQGAEFCRALEQLVEELHTVIPAAFEGEDYRSRKGALEEEINKKEELLFKDMQQRAKADNFALLRTEEGLAFAPLKEGEVIKPDEYQKLAADEQGRIENKLGALQNELQVTVRKVQQLDRIHREKVKEMEREITIFAIEHLFDELREKYSARPNIISHLEVMEQDIVENADDFRKQEEETQPSLAGTPLPRSLQGPPSMRRFQVNVLVDHSQKNGAPVIYQDHPIYPNLMGRVEHVTSQMGTLITDFTLIRPGSLHQANGGYLMLDAHKVLTQPQTWEALKRVLRAGEITVESLGQQFGMVSTISLEPEAIPLDIKIILIGDRGLYYSLSQFDPDFNELFKVVVDFEEEMERNRENNLLYARLIGTLAKKENLRHFDRSGVARVIERSSRMVGDAQRLSTRMQGVADLLREAHYWGKQNGDETVTATNVQQAIAAQIHRTGRIRERMQEEIERGTILIDTDGQKIGQINGLSVLSMGQFSFGRPSRITARVWLGRGKVVDIEREVELGGPLHSKGVLILTGFLSARYIPNDPLSLNASLVFEQSYGGVDGDSASSAELYALLSALAEAPINQSLAVTGSVNQHGHIQAIGGVNEKIEGFFDLCHSRKLTGSQGALIPEANVKHLMLRRDVVEAVEAGQFHIYPVASIDQGIEILTGLSAGKRDSDGNFPKGSINRRVEARLIAFSKRWLLLSRNEEK